MAKKAPQKIEITHRSIIFTILALIGFWFLYYIRDIILMLFVAILIMAIMNPLATKLAKFKIPRGISILLAYILVIGSFIFAVAAVVPPLVEQSGILVHSIPDLSNQLGLPTTLAEQILNEFVRVIGELSREIAQLTLDLFSNILQVVTVLILAFYLVVSRDKFPIYTKSLFSEKTTKEINKILGLMEKKLGGWMMGQAALMLLVGLTTYAGLLLLKVPFALPLAILAGLLEIVPYLGPIIAAIPMVIIGFSVTPVMGIAVVALSVLIQQLENYLFVPKVMHKSTGVHPVVVLVALAVGAQVAGVVGVLLAVPVVLTLQIFASEYLARDSH